MPVASHTLSWPVNVTNAASGAQIVTAIQLTLNTDSVNDAITAAQMVLQNADALLTGLNTGTVTYV